MLDESALCRILKVEIATYDRVYLIIDALDAYSEGLLLWLTNDLMSLCPEKLSIMASSRDPDIDTAINSQCDSCGDSNINMYFRCKVCKKLTFVQRVRSKVRHATRTMNWSRPVRSTLGFQHRRMRSRGT